MREGHKVVHPEGVPLRDLMIHAAAGYGVRRAARQKRSKEKLARVMRSATELLREGGSAAVTTTTVAARAGVSVGWLYQYFDNRDALLEEILIDWLTNLDTRLEEAGFDLGGPDWRKKAEAGVDVHIDFFGAEDGFRQMWFSTEFSGRMTEANRRHDSALADYLCKSVTRVRADAPDVPLSVVTQVFVGMLDKGVDLAYREDPVTGNRALLLEMKRSSVEYLATFLP